MRKLMFLLFCFVFQWSFSQEQKADTLSYDVFISLVKKHHPIAKQADLKILDAEAKLLKSRGLFDPKIESNFSQKEFKDTKYYKEFSSTFKIPLWYGVDIKATYEDNDGKYLDPSLTVPDNGLYNVGISLPIAQDFIFNKRDIGVKKAKEYGNLAKEEKRKLILDLIYDASLAYFYWYKSELDVQVFENSLTNARTRFEATKKSFIQGEKAAIDTLEAKIILDSRRLGLENAQMMREKAKLNVSNYLWLKDVPVEIQNKVTPTEVNENRLTELAQSVFTNDQLVENHPKIKMLQSKLDISKLDVKLKKNALLPKINLEYNFLSPNLNSVQSLDIDNYKFKVKFSLPIFLRKERGDLRLTKNKIRDLEYQTKQQTLEIQNKIKAYQIEYNSIVKQKELAIVNTKNYGKLVKAEERKFFLGESALFTINYREQKWIEAQLKNNDLLFKLVKTKISLIQNSGIEL
ncbi:TolC family protein [Aureivirga sp. CE67]|uniref:TolC family protein n=1 Tax=Aureivirga sp. CE67 TaxID=1788983 RepID=UPI0018CB38BA|nr:TolC family protein [Aureivirga sp. CE67]